MTNVSDSFDKRHYCSRSGDERMSLEAKGGAMAASIVLEPCHNTSVGSPEGSVIASLRSVSKKFGQQVALDRLSLELRRGEVVALLGPNGAGKTTAVRLLLGLSQATSGEVRIFGGTARDGASRVRLGAMLQVGRLPETLRVREHLQLFSSYYAQPRPLNELLAVAGLEGLEERLFGQLSGGQKQRVLFALALCGNPDLIFLDEPTVGMDIEARRGLWTEIRLLAAMGKTVLLTTHSLEEPAPLAARIIVINKGRVICEGTPAEIKRNSGGRRIRCNTSLSTAVLQSLTSVTNVEQNGEATTVTATHAENVVREMLRRD